MATNTFKRGDFVKYTGHLARFSGTWWTVTAANRDRFGRLIDYTLENKGVGRLLHVSPGSVSQDQEARV
jgi:hypothetical protein